jgi:hypothetical protein
MSRIFRFNGTNAEEAQRISASDLKKAFESKSSGLFQFVGGRWFKARIREEDSGEGHELENWIPEPKPHAALLGAADQPQASNSASAAKGGRGQSATEAIMSGDLDPNKPAATDAAKAIHASPNLQERQHIAGAGQPGPGSATPEAQSQEEKRLEEKMLEGATGVQQSQPKSETTKPASPTPPMNPPAAPKVAVPGGGKEAK